MLMEATRPGSGAGLNPIAIFCLTPGAREGAHIVMLRILVGACLTGHPGMTAWPKSRAHIDRLARTQTFASKRSRRSKNEKRMKSYG